MTAQTALLSERISPLSYACPEPNTGGVCLGRPQTLPKGGFSHFGSFLSLFLSLSNVLPDPFKRRHFTSQNKMKPVLHCQLHEFLNHLRILKSPRFCPKAPRQGQSHQAHHCCRHEEVALSCFCHAESRQALRSRSCQGTGILRALIIGLVSFALDIPHGISARGVFIVLTREKGLFSRQDCVC